MERYRLKYYVLKDVNHPSDGGHYVDKDFEEEDDDAARKFVKKFTTGTNSHRRPSELIKIVNL